MQLRCIARVGCVKGRLVPQLLQLLLEKVLLAAPRSKNTPQKESPRSQNRKKNLPDLTM
jgi:hypothetical protein